MLTGETKGQDLRESDISDLGEFGIQLFHLVEKDDTREMLLGRGFAHDIARFGQSPRLATEELLKIRDDESITEAAVLINFWGDTNGFLEITKNSAVEMLTRKRGRLVLRELIHNREYMTRAWRRKDSNRPTGVQAELTEDYKWAIENYPSNSTVEGVLPDSFWNARMLQDADLRPNGIVGFRIGTLLRTAITGPEPIRAVYYATPEQKEQPEPTAA